MEISPRKPPKRAQEPVDEWLQAEGYFRKHAPRDPTCLFRAVSEQVYHTQYYHIRVRKECVDFMRKMRHMFEQTVAISFESYLEQMACFTEWGGLNEIQAMSLLYKREFVIFNGHKQSRRTVTSNGFKDSIYLCYTGQKQYESIFTKNFVATAAYCQSTVYQILYKEVFKMNSIEGTVNKMLHDRNTVFKHNKFFLKGNLEIREQLTMEIYNKFENPDEDDDMLKEARGIPPFPYRVAKALDPNIYRNIDFDIWHEIRREVKNAGWTKHNTHELQVGGKCLVQMQCDDEDSDNANNNDISAIGKDTNENDLKTVQKRNKSPVYFCGHIQEMSKNEGPVLVFIEELGEKRTVPYSALKPLPLRKNRPSVLPSWKEKPILSSTNQKWKKSSNNNTRRGKEITNTYNILSNDFDRNGNPKLTVDNISNPNYSVDNWKQDSLKITTHPPYEHYSTENNSNYQLNNSAELFTPTNINGHSEQSSPEKKQELHKGVKNMNFPFDLSQENNNNNNSKNSTVTSAVNSDNISTYRSQSKPRSQKDSFNYPADNLQTTSPNTNSYYNTANVSPFTSYDQVDRMLRAVNCSVQKSIDVNGRDLPLSDLFTLRFFYNLGLEYFRTSQRWSYSPNGASPFPSWYQGTPENGNIGTPPSNAAQASPSPAKEQFPSDSKSPEKHTPPQEILDKNANSPKEVPHKTDSPKSDTSRGSYSPREKLKDASNESRDLPKMCRNTLAPRFKRNAESRNRNPSVQASGQRQQPISPPQQSRGMNGKKPEDSKTEPSPPPKKNPPQPIHLPAAPPNSYTPYVQQGVYGGVPYYGSEAEPFGSSYYPPSPGFYSVPYVPHAEMPENGNMSPAYPPHMYSGIDYAQSYTGLYPSYMYPPPSAYNIPQPQNVPEHGWYAVPGQPNFVQYPPAMVPVSADSAAGVLGQGSNPAASP